MSCRPGGKPIMTKHVTEDRVEQVYSFLKKQIDSGRQAYVVYPVIEESETQAMKAAEKMYQHALRIVFPDIPVGLLHGRLVPDEKESVMAAIQAGRDQDPGLHHRDRGRCGRAERHRDGDRAGRAVRSRAVAPVARPRGRGAEQSYCILVTGKLNDAGRERIRTLVESTDGFYIAEMDLKLRGPGEFFGTRQSGLPALRIANIIRDEDILEIARNEADAFMRIPPSDEDLRRAVAYIRDHWQRRYGLVQVG